MEESNKPEITIEHAQKFETFIKLIERSTILSKKYQNDLGHPMVGMSVLGKFCGKANDIVVNNYFAGGDFESFKDRLLEIASVAMLMYENFDQFLLNEQSQNNEENEKQE